MRDFALALPDRYCNASRRPLAFNSDLAFDYSSVATLREGCGG
jgi:hypothetical protein